MRVRAIQGYSTMITAELLFDSRTKVNTRYEQTSQRRIPVYLLGDAAAGTEGLGFAERAGSAKIEFGMPGGVPKNFPDVIAHDTENMHRESIMKYGLKPGGFGRKTRDENHFYVLPARLFEERCGDFAEWRNHNSHDGFAGQRSLRSGTGNLRMELLARDLGAIVASIGQAWHFFRTAFTSIVHLLEHW